MVVIFNFAKFLLGLVTERSAIRSSCKVKDTSQYLTVSIPESDTELHGDMQPAGLPSRGHTELDTIDVTQQQQQHVCAEQTPWTVLCLFHSVLMTETPNTLPEQMTSQHESGRSSAFLPINVIQSLKRLSQNITPQPP